MELDFDGILLTTCMNENCLEGRLMDKYGAKTKDKCLCCLGTGTVPTADGIKLINFLKLWAGKV